MEIIHTSRFKGFPWHTPEKDTIVVIGGAGGIGSWLALLLSRMDIKFFIYDDDKIEAHNIGGQLFTTNSIGYHKVAEVAEICRNFSGYVPNILTYKIDHNTVNHNAGIFFSAFDNMEARKVSFNLWKDVYSESPKIFIDGRLLGEQLQIYCVTEATANLYEEEHLFDSSEIPELEVGCTTKQTSHSAAMIASHMVGFFTNFLANRETEFPMRDLPFFYEYNIPLNLTTILDGNIEF